MEIGFILGNVIGYEEEAIKYIRSVCLLLDPEIADNIVALGEGTPVYTNINNLEAVLGGAVPFFTTENQQFFSTSVEEFWVSGLPTWINSTIKTSTTKYLVRSKVGFITELVHNGGVIRLKSMEFIYLEESIAKQLYQYEEIGLIKIYPKDIIITAP